MPPFWDAALGRVFLYIMAKNFPYFKFIATEWLTGNIVFEPLNVQGLFINICALYWQRDGKLTLEDIKMRYNSPIELTKLTDRFFSVNDGFISLSFLDEQLIQADHISKTNSENGKLGGRPKATAKRIKAKKNKKERKEETESEEKKIAKTLDLDKLLFEYKGTYTPDMLKAFHNWWSEKNGNGKEKWTLQETWETSKRLATWHKRSQETFKGKVETKERSVGPLLENKLGLTK